MIKLPGSASFSQMYTAGVCLRKFLLTYVVGIKEGPRPALTFGSAVHAGLASLNRARKDGKKGSVDDALGAFVETAAEHPEAAAREGDAARLFKRHEDFADAAARPVVEVEAHTTLILKDGAQETRVKGYVDLIDGTDPAILDYKTAARRPPKTAADNSLQLAIYGAASGARDAALVHLVPDRKDWSITRQPTVVTPERVETAATWLAGQERLIRTCRDTGNWPRRPPDGVCDMCFLKKLCWEGERHPLYDIYKRDHGDPDESRPPS